MKYINCLILFLIIAGLVIGCDGSLISQEPGPADGAREWIDAITNQDGNRMLKYTCLAQRENLQQSLVWAAAFSAVAEMFTLGAVDVKIEGDISDLHFEAISQSGDQATVRVYGELRISPTAGIAEAYQVDEEWPMVRENETWRWCGSSIGVPSLAPTSPSPVTLSSPSEGKFVFAIADSTSICKKITYAFI